MVEAATVIIHGAEFSTVVNPGPLFPAEQLVNIPFAIA